MKILVTAFGPFNGRSENASALVLSELVKSFPDMRRRVLPVDSVVAPARLRQALRVLRPDALILLGEAAGCKSIRLETTAWNELNFKIPDIAGRKPEAMPISLGSAPIHRSTLPLKKISAALASNGHDVSQSNDPGRYLCNQVFFLSLEFIQQLGLNCRAGFIHLPLAGDYPVSRAADAIGHVIRAL